MDVFMSDCKMVSEKPSVAQEMSTGNGIGEAQKVRCVVTASQGQTLIKQQPLNALWMVRCDGCVYECVLTHIYKHNVTIQYGYILV